MALALTMGDTGRSVSRRIEYEHLPTSDLVVGAVYAQGPQASVAAEPLHRLLPGVGNQGGFRAAGSVALGTVRYVAIYTSGEDPDWPDRLDEETGLFSYFGDNKRPGADLHATTRSGNRLLQRCFDALHGEPPARSSVPPFLVFAKATPGGNRDAVFLGLAVPGGRDVPPSADLVALWRTTAGERFQNYRATFTILDVAVVSRDWMNELADGIALGPACPDAFRRFVQEGAYDPLEAPRTRQFRRPSDQAPSKEWGRALVQSVYEYFASDPYAFEACAIELWKMATGGAVTFIEGTRRSADGGRDAVGLYSLGPPGDPIHLDFSLEAKCYAPTNHA
ncbi:MAG: hypothetical protein RJQ03_06560, partial [Miltoncostaeaceae bacterium]